jgi:hypothetical protein
VAIESAQQFGAHLASLVEIEILLLPSGYWPDDAVEAKDLRGECVERLSGDAAADLVTMVSVLPWGEQARCHMPRYGLRARLHDGALLALSICFECNNARTFQDSDRGWFTFDGSSPEATRLLERLRQARS